MISAQKAKWKMRCSREDEEEKMPKRKMPKRKMSARTKIRLKKTKKFLVLDIANVAQSTISRQGAPKRSKANTFLEHW